jgi:hypothetical protein
MPTYNFTVDTNPMADQMRGVSKQVGVTTVAVGALQAAVILAEENSAKDICSKLNTGFHTMIRSQLSQKIAHNQSKVDALEMELTMQKKNLENVRNRMKRDYDRITSRYKKLFNSLNANLRKRVFELDKPTADFAVKEVNKISNRTRYLPATVPVAQLETVTACQKILASNVKNRSLHVIRSMRSFLLEMNTQKKLTDRVLINDGRRRSSGPLFIPVVLFEHNTDAGTQVFDIVLPDTLLDNVSRSSIKNNLHTEVSNLPWSTNPAQTLEVKSEFHKMASASSDSQRVKDMIMNMFNASEFETIKT